MSSIILGKKTEWFEWLLVYSGVNKNMELFNSLTGRRKVILKQCKCYNLLFYLLIHIFNTEIKRHF